MKKLLTFVVCASALIAAPAHAQSIDQARAFVRGLYAQYGHPEVTDGPNILGPHAAKIFK